MIGRFQQGRASVELNLSPDRQPAVLLLLLLALSTLRLSLFSDSWNYHHDYHFDCCSKNIDAIIVIVIVVIVTAIVMLCGSCLLFTAA